MGKKMVKIRPRETGDSVLPSKSITKLDFVTQVSVHPLCLLRILRSLEPQILPRVVFEVQARTSVNF